MINPQDLVVTKVAPQCGAEVSGLNLAQPLDKEPIVQALSMALAEHGVLFFRNQSMTAEQQKRLGSYFGDLHLHPAWPRLVDGHPEVMELLTDENSSLHRGRGLALRCFLRPAATVGNNPADAGSTPGRRVTRCLPTW